MRWKLTIWTWDLPLFDFVVDATSLPSLKTSHHEPRKASSGAFIVLCVIHTIVKQRIGTIAVAALVVTAALVGVVGTSSALEYTNIGDPTLETTVDGPNVVQAGETTTLAVTVRNSGQSMTTLNGPVREFDRVVRAQ